MKRPIRVEKWLGPTSGILGGAVVLVLLQHFGGNSPTISGAIVFVAATLTIVLLVLWNRAERTHPIHGLVYWLIPVAIVVLGINTDFDYIKEHGLIVNITGVVALLVGGFIARSRT